MRSQRIINFFASFLLITVGTTTFAQEKVDRARGGAALKVEFDSPLRDVYPDIDMFHLDGRRYGRQQTADIVSLNTALYNFTREERDRFTSLLEKEASDRELKFDRNSYESVLTQRAERFISVVGEYQQSGKDPSEVLLKDEELQDLQKKIMEYQRIGDPSFEQTRLMAEKMVGDKRASQARALWAENLRKVRGRITNQSLITKAMLAEGLSADVIMTPVNEKKPSPDTKEANQEKKRRRREPRRSKNLMTPIDNPKAKGEEKPQPSNRSAKRTTVKRSDEKKDAEPSKRNKASRQKTAPRAKVIPLDEWEQFVRDFIKKHELTSAQTHSALSILEELKGQAADVKMRNEKEREKAESLSDRKEKQKKLQELDKPIARLFDNLKARLDRLLTAQQRAKARENNPPKRRSKRG